MVGVSNVSTSFEGLSDKSIEKRVGGNRMEDKYIKHLQRSFGEELTVKFNGELTSRHSKTEMFTILFSIEDALTQSKVNKSLERDSR